MSSWRAVLIRILGLLQWQTLTETKNRTLKCQMALSDCASWRRTGHFPSFFVPTPGDLTAQESPPPGICHPRQKNANARGQLWPKKLCNSPWKKRQKNVSKLARTYNCFLSSLMWCKNKLSNSFTENAFIHSLSLVLFAFFSISCKGQLSLDWWNTWEKMLFFIDQEILDVFTVAVKHGGKRTHDNIINYSHPL